MRETWNWYLTSLLWQFYLIQAIFWILVIIAVGLTGIFNLKEVMPS